MKLGHNWSSSCMYITINYWDFSWEDVKIWKKKFYRLKHKGTFSKFFMKTWLVTSFCRKIRIDLKIWQFMWSHILWAWLSMQILYWLILSRLNYMSCHNIRNSFCLMMNNSLEMRSYQRIDAHLDENGSFYIISSWLILPFSVFVHVSEPLTGN